MPGRCPGWRALLPLYAGALLVAAPALAQVGELARVAEKGGERLVYEIPIMVLLVLALVGVGAWLLHLKDKRHGETIAALDKRHTAERAAADEAALKERNERAAERERIEAGAVKERERLIAAWEARLAAVEKARDEERLRHEAALAAMSDKCVTMIDRSGKAGEELALGLQSIRHVLAESKADADERAAALSAAIARSDADRIEMRNAVTELRDAERARRAGR